jgi:hypothetical protein
MMLCERAGWGEWYVKIHGGRVNVEEVRGEGVDGADEA